MALPAKTTLLPKPVHTLYTNIALVAVDESFRYPHSGTEPPNQPRTVSHRPLGVMVIVYTLTNMMLVTMDGRKNMTRKNL